MRSYFLQDPSQGHDAEHETPPLVEPQAHALEHGIPHLMAQVCITWGTQVPQYSQPFAAQGVVPADFVAHGTDMAHFVAHGTAAVPFQALQQSQHFVAQGVALVDPVAHGTDAAHFVAHFMASAAFKAA